jgi:hypothetical protein
VVLLLCPAGAPTAELDPVALLSGDAEEGEAEAEEDAEDCPEADGVLEGVEDALGELDCEDGIWLWSAAEVLGAVEALGVAEVVLLGFCADWSVLVLVLDCSLIMLLCGGVEVEGVAFGVLFGLLPVGGFSLMLPCEFDSGVTPVVLLLPAEVPTLEELAAGLVLDATVSLSLTPFTPETDFASFLASFLSFLLGTVPVSETLPLLTSMFTFCRSGFVAS